MKTRGKELFLMIILSFSAVLVSGQNTDFIARLKTQLLLYRTQSPSQVIVIQTDKTLYRQGETMWMKGYAVDAITHSLSLNSLELSVQLSDSKGANILDGKFLLKSGVTNFNFTIPADLPSDVYYLIAYSPEMENGDISKIFKKEIFIGRPENLDMVPHLEFSKPFYPSDSKEAATLRIMNFSGKPASGKKYDYQIFCHERELLSGKGKTGSNGTGEIVFFTPPKQNGYPLLASITIYSGKDRLNLISKIPLSAEKINVTFFPEGGTRVPGILQSIVFEAKDLLGNPIDLKSDILDEQGKVITSTATIQPGIGVFNVQNGNNGKLIMRVISDPGKNQEIPLPALVPGGMSISLKKNDGQLLSLMLGRTPKSDSGKFNIVAVNNGEMVWASEFEIEDSGIINVPLVNLRSAVTSFAVFSQTGLMVANRLVYTGNNEFLNISSKSDKPIYKTAEDGEIRVKITDAKGAPVRAELAVSLADKSTFPSSSKAIESIQFGLNKAIHSGEPIEKISSPTLDYLLAGNSLNGFEWSQVLAMDPLKGTSRKSGAIRISGTVVDDKNLPVPYALVSLTSSSLQQFNAGSDQNGVFAINLPISVDKKTLTSSATDSTGKWKFHVKLNKSFKDEIVNYLNIVTVNNWQILDQIFQSNYFRENLDFFKARPSVKVRSGEKKIPEAYWKRYLTGSANLLDILKSIRSFELSGNKIVFRGMNSFLQQDGALIVIDGQQMGSDASQLSMLNPMDIEDIRILLDPAEMGIYTGLNSVGVIEIKTKNSNSLDLKSPEIADPVKDNSSKLFTPEPIGESKYNLKTTLQWFPVLSTDAKGEATIPFRTGNIHSTFILEIAGFSDTKQWISGQMEIKVE